MKLFVTLFFILKNHKNIKIKIFVTLFSILTNHKNKDKGFRYFILYKIKIKIFVTLFCILIKHKNKVIPLVLRGQLCSLPEKKLKRK